MRLKDKLQNIRNPLITFHNEKTKKSIVYVWFITYLCILIIPMLVGGMMYMRINSLYKNELSNYNDLSLKNAMIRVENVLDEAQKLSVDLAKSPIMLTLSDTSSYDRNSYWRLGELSEYMYQKKSGLSEYISFYIYIGSLDRVIRPEGTSDARSFVHGYYSAADEDYTKWLKMISRSYQNEYVLFSDDGKVNLMQSVPIGAKNSFFANIVISIDFYELFKDDEKSGLSKNKNVFLYNKQNALMYSGAEKDSEMEEELKSYLGNHDEDFVYRKVKYKVSGVTSEKYDWTLAVTEPSKLFWSKVKSANMVFFTFYTVCLLIGLAVIVFIIRWQYRPIKEILSSFSRGGRGEKKDFQIAEYRDIHNMIEDIILRNNAAEEKIFRQQRIVKSHALQKLISGELKYNTAEGESMLAELGFDEELFTVVIFQILEYDGLFYGEEGMDEQQKTELANLVIMNISEELVSERYRGKVAVMGDCIACAVNHKKETAADFKNDLLQLLEEMNKFIKNNFYIDYYAAVGVTVADSQKVHESYESAKRAMDYLLLEDVGNCMFYDDMQETHGIYYYPLAVEIQLVNCLKNGESKKMSALIDEIFEKNPTISKQGKGAVNRLVYSMLNTLINGCPDDIPALSDKAAAGAENMERLLLTGDLQGIRKEMNRLFSECCLLMGQRKETESNNSLVKSVVEYVHQNCTDYDISVAIIAQKMNIHPYYLSTVFKKNMGIGLLEYINKMKIEKAKNILKADKRVTLEKLAEKVGVSNYRSLLRIFKKYTGMSPTEYKEANTENLKS